MKETGIVISVVGKKAVVKRDNISGNESSDIIIKTKQNIKEHDRVSIISSSRFSTLQLRLIYLSPLFAFLVAFGVGFLFYNEIAHFGFILGLYGLSMIIMMSVKTSIETNTNFKYEIKVIGNNTEKHKEKIVKEKNSENIEENIKDTVEIYENEDATDNIPDNGDNIEVAKEENEIKEEVNE